MEKENMNQNEAAGISSIFLIDVQKDSFAYRYDVEVELILPNMRTKSLTKSKDDVNKKVCSHLIKTVFELTGNFGDEELVYAYDNRAIMFTSKPILNGKDKITIKNCETSNFVRKFCGDKNNFCVTIKETETSHVVNLSNYDQYAQEKTLLYEERSIRNCLEMLLSKEAVEKHGFVSTGSGFLYEEKEKKLLKNGICLKFGISKGVGVVKNGKGGIQPAVFVDITHASFFKSQNLIESVKSMFYPKDSTTLTADDWKEFQGLYKALPVQKITFPFEGKEISIPQYYIEVKKIPLRFPHFPGVVNQIRKPDGSLFEEVLPLEVLYVIDNQHVPAQKKSPDVMDAIRQENIIPPHARFNLIKNSMNKLVPDSSKNEFLRKFGVRVNMQSNEVRLKYLDKPRISMGNKLIDPEDKTNWRTATLSYSKPTSIKKWAILCKPEDKKDVVIFVNEIIKAGKNKGMQFNNPKIVHLNDEDDLYFWSDMFCHFAQKNFDFVLYIGEHSKNVAGDAKTNHRKIKLFESLYKVSTEHISMESIQKCLARDVSTLQNILNKINCKNSGLNYFPLARGNEKYALEKGDTLVISYDVCHPKPSKQRMNFEDPTFNQLEPSVVGICANVGHDPHYFIGDHFFQKPRQESADSEMMIEYIKWLLKSLAKNRPKNSRPLNIFIVRDGISQGQYEMAYNEELQSIKKAFYEFDPKYAPKFVMIISTKDHNKLFGEYSNGKIYNPYPGAVVDSKFVRNDCFEFYLLAHNPPQGTARFTQYNVILNEINMSIDEIEDFVHALCYEHQIISAAVSIPASVYLADKLASRGDDLYMELKKLYNELKDIIPDLPNVPAGQEDYKQLSNRLGCKNSRLETTNFRA